MVLGVREFGFGLNASQAPKLRLSEFGFPKRISVSHFGRCFVVKK
jgi:hypothetical protein